MYRFPFGFTACMQEVLDEHEEEKFKITRDGIAAALMLTPSTIL